jgi:hypothetical protein
MKKSISSGNPDAARCMRGEWKGEKRPAFSVPCCASAMSGRFPFLLPLSEYANSIIGAQEHKWVTGNSELLPMLSRFDQVAYHHGREFG